MASLPLASMILISLLLGVRASAQDPFEIHVYEYESLKLGSSDAIFGSISFLQMPAPPGEQTRAADDLVTALRAYLK